MSREKDNWRVGLIENPRLGVHAIQSMNLKYVKVAYLLFGFSLYSRSNLCPSSYSLAIGNESVKKGEIGLTHNPK